MYNNSSILIYLNKTTLCTAIAEGNCLKKYTIKNSVDGVINKDAFNESVAALKLEYPLIENYIIGVDDKKIMLAPYYWNDAEIKQEFDALHSLEEAEELITQHIDWKNYRGFFSVKKSSKNLFAASSTHTSICNNHIALLNLYQKYLTKELDANPIVVCINKSIEYFTATVFKDGQLQLQNIFPYESKVDIEYCLHSIAQFLNIDIKQIVVYTSNLRGVPLPAPTYELEHIIPFMHLEKDEYRNQDYIINLLALLS